MRAENAGREPVSAREFCRWRGLRESSFYPWRREIDRRKSGAGHSDALFVLVTVMAAPAAAHSPIELEIAGATLRILPAFDEAPLARLIAVLRPTFTRRA